MTTLPRIVRLPCPDKEVLGILNTMIKPAETGTLNVAGVRAYSPYVCVTEGSYRDTRIQCFLQPV